MKKQTKKTKKIEQDKIIIPFKALRKGVIINYYRL